MADDPEFHEDYEEHDELPYVSEDQIDFSVIIMGLKRLPFFQDDTYLGMQAMNVGVVDALITKQEYALLRKQFEDERTPTDLAYMISALSQMWIFAVYEVLRMWRDRRFEFTKLATSGGIDAKLGALDSNDGMNATIEVRKRQLTQYRDDTSYRQEVESVWSKLEPAYRMIELFRMNLAKHAAPGRDTVMPRAPGYGRINRWCGSMDYELIDREGYYSTMNRRDIADALRSTLHEV